MAVSSRYALLSPKGITPIIQVLRAIIQDNDDTRTRVYLISANKTEQDILCRNEIDALTAANGSRISVFYVLSSVQSVADSWQQGRGRVNEAILRRYLPKPPEVGTETADSAESMVLCCGPLGMVESVKQELSSIGWDVDRDLVVF
jgi:nitrate reductase (NAD(P)H)